MLIETDAITLRTVTGRVAAPDDTPPVDPVVVELLDTIRETSTRRTVVPSILILDKPQWSVQLPTGAAYRVRLDGVTKVLDLPVGGPISASDWMA